MKRRLRALLIRWVNRLRVKPDPAVTISNLQAQRDMLLKLLPEQQDRNRFAEYMEFAGEWVEARLMAGAGPWRLSTGPMEAGRALTRIRERALGQLPEIALKEADIASAQGAFGDIELALQNVEWRRETNYSWLEFSRWGIQQIILISRLYYIKQPVIRRLIDIASQYVFGRGVEVSSPDKTADATLREFFQRNKKVLGQNALVKLEKRKYYDGNLFFALMADTLDKGLVECRMIDATEIQEIVCDPDDSEKPWYYRRVWTSRAFDEQSGSVAAKTQEAWYPAISYEPTEKPEQIRGQPVIWDCRVHHRKCGEVASWSFGCPMIYPALDWAKSVTRFLSACLTKSQALSNIAMSITTRGGQQALEGIKQQLQTNVNVGSSPWDTNPPQGMASTFASGPGTTLSAFNTRGAGDNPEEVRQYKLMCCMVVGVPETFLADVSTGNLATATTLDRPTELCFLEKQEAWREDLLVIAEYVLRVSKGAPSGQLRESLSKNADVRICEMRRVKDKRGNWTYVETTNTTNTIEIKVNFPNIVEGDIPALITATTDAMTLGNKGGQITGIDEKEGVRRLGELIGLPNNDEIVEEMFPKGEYEPDRTIEPELPPIPKALPDPGGQPQLPGGKTAEALRRLIEAGRRLAQ